VFIKYEAEVSSRVGGGERGVVDFGKLFTETNEQKFSLGGVYNNALVVPCTEWKIGTIRYDMRCYYNVQSKADTSQLNLPHGTKKTKSVKQKN